MPVLGVLATGDSGEHISHAAHLAVSEKTATPAREVYLLFNGTIVEVWDTDDDEKLIARWSTQRRKDQEQASAAVRGASISPPTQGTPFAPPLMLVRVCDGVTVNPAALAAVERMSDGHALIVLHSGRRIETGELYDVVMGELSRAAALSRAEQP